MHELIKLALDNLEYAKYTEAEEILSKYLLLDKNCAEVYIMLGDCLYEKKNLKQAVKNYKKGLSLNLNLAQSSLLFEGDYFSTGLNYIHINIFEKKMLDTTPENLEKYLNLIEKILK